GREVFEQIRLIAPTVKVIFTSASASGSHRAKMRNNSMKHVRNLVTLCLTGLLLSAQPASELTLRGFSAESSRAERDWEVKYAAIPEPKKVGEYMQRLSARPHHVGSPYDKDNAEWILATLKGW